MSNSVSIVKVNWSSYPGFLTAQIALGLLSALALDCCFPLGGPMPRWHGSVAWIALVPLMLAILRKSAILRRRYICQAAIIGYVAGVTWCGLNSYWIYRTMRYYGGMSSYYAAGLLLLYSLVLGGYWGVFTLALAVLRKRLGVLPALCLAPFIWPAVELLAYHLTCVPWDQLGYAQVDNFWLTRVAPITGTYGIATVIMLGNALFVVALLKVPYFLRSISLKFGDSVCWLITALIFSVAWQIGSWMPPPPAPTSSSALLLQVNLGTQDTPDNDAMTWDAEMSRFIAASGQYCRPYLGGIPKLTTTEIVPNCSSVRGSHPNLIVWPESPAPFVDEDPAFREDISILAKKTGAAAIIGDTAIQFTLHSGHPVEKTYNSASVFSSRGIYIGRYDKIHLVPFGEYTPFRKYLSWASALTDRIGKFNHGTRYLVFPINHHLYGIFICYESIFSNEVRIFAKNGAQVFVNISDDAWYGDTSAPWQHLNMARMRAIENDRWLLIDTNNGITAAVDPDGRVTQAVPRNQFTALVARYGFEHDHTFYTRYGDIYAFFCCAIALSGLFLASFGIRGS